MAKTNEAPAQPEALSWRIGVAKNTLIASSTEGHTVEIVNTGGSGGVKSKNNHLTIHVNLNVPSRLKSKAFSRESKDKLVERTKAYNKTLAKQRSEIRQSAYNECVKELKSAGVDDSWLTKELFYQIQ